MRTSTGPRALTYGRRKFIPGLIVIGVLSVAGAASARTVGGRLYGVAMVVFCGVFAWRYWSEPMPARLKARLERINPEDGRFGSKAWHKVAVAMLVGLALLFAALVTAASMQ